MSIIAKLRDNKKALKIGIFLLIINPPLGYLGFVIGGYLCTRYNDTTYLTAATVFYMFTWVLFGMGFILAGTVGIDLAKKYWRNFLWKKRQK
jgi:hypothetical protein